MKKLHAGMSMVSKSMQVGIDSTAGCTSPGNEHGTLTWSLAASNQQGLLPPGVLSGHNVAKDTDPTGPSAFHPSPSVEEGRNAGARSWDTYALQRAQPRQREIPVPPPLPLAHSAAFATQQRRLWPIVELRQVVKRWALASPELPKTAAAHTTQDLLGSVLELLDAAALSRHIARRSRQAGAPLVSSPAAANVEVSVADAERAFAGTFRTLALDRGDEVAGTKHRQSGIANLEEIIKWMNSDQGGCAAKYSRVREVEALCLRFVLLYVRLCAAAGMGVNDEQLLSSSLLPVMEDNLDAGIQDMETPHSVFAISIALVYAFTLVPNMCTLLRPVGPEWKPPQRLSLVELCHEADKVLGSLLARLHRRPSAAQPPPGARHALADVAAEAGGEADDMDVGYLDAVRQLVAAVTACAPSLVQAGVQPDQQIRRAQSSNQVAWSMMPSVVTWCGGTRIVGWEQAYEARYVQAMEEIRLEAVAGLAETHAFCKAAAAEKPPRKLAKRLMQELVAMQRDLPLSLREAVMVRFDEERADVIKLLIVGCTDTPYAGGCFEYHIWCPPTYPEVPPHVALVTTGGGKIRFNPNLYEDGLVCSSLLNQGSGWGQVTWRSGESNLVEVCKALMWVHMTAEVYFAEPDTEDLIGTEEGQAANEAYCDIVRYGNVRYAMLQTLRKPPKDFENVVQVHFSLRKADLLALCESWLVTAQQGIAGHGCWSHEPCAHYALADDIVDVDDSDEDDLDDEDAPGDDDQDEIHDDKTLDIDVAEHLDYLSSHSHDSHPLHSSCLWSPPLSHSPSLPDHLPHSLAQDSGMLAEAEDSASYGDQEEEEEEEDLTQAVGLLDDRDGAVDNVGKNGGLVRAGPQSGAGSCAFSSLMGEKKAGSVPVELDLTAFSSSSSSSGCAGSSCAADSAASAASTSCGAHYLLSASSAGSASYGVKDNMLMDQVNAVLDQYCGANTCLVVRYPTSLPSPPPFCPPCSCMVSDAGKFFAFLTHRLLCQTYESPPMYKEELFGELSGGPAATAPDELVQCDTKMQDASEKTAQATCPAAPTQLASVPQWSIRQRQPDAGLATTRRSPMPNYLAEFVQAHNPDLADRFDARGSAYWTDLSSTVRLLRIELAKLPAAPASSLASSLP